MFHVEELEAARMARAGHDAHIPTLRGLINHLRKEGCIKGVRQRVFQSLVASTTSDPLDPWLTASRLDPRAILSHGTALAWHVGSPPPSPIHFLSIQIAHPWPKDSPTLVPVQGRFPGLGIMTASQNGHSIRITTPERTLVDLLRRPDLQTDRFATWEDFFRLPLKDDALLLTYLRAMRSRSTNAKVAYFLSHLEDHHPLRRSCLPVLGKEELPFPKHNAPWDYYTAAPDWPSQGTEPRSEWSLRVPSDLAKMEIQGLTDPLADQGRTYFGDSEIGEGYLREDLEWNFKFTNYRPGQLLLVRRVLEGGDALGILPTGSGKSLAYLQPSSLLTGPTIVISPLIALIEDQVQEARKFKLNAFALNKNNREKALPEVRKHLEDQSLHLLFLPPESWRWLFNAIPALRIRTRQIVVDEAHVVVDWGRSFRSAYLRLHEIREKCEAPILALTATATRRTQGEIARALKLHGIKPQSYPVRKENLFLAAEHLPFPSEMESMLRSGRLSRQAECEIKDAIYEIKKTALLGALTCAGSFRGIIYCERKFEANKLALDLGKALKIRVETYHGDTEDALRTDRLVAFKKDEIQIMVATLAFGLGVNITDLRFVIHFGMPTSLDAYTQAIGRAGRDEVQAHCLVIHVHGEEHFLRKAVRFAKKGRAASKRVIRRRLGQIAEVLKWLDASKCRHQLLDTYFGIPVSQPCQTACDVCSTRPHTFLAPHAQPNEEKILDLDPPPPIEDYLYDFDLEAQCKALAE